MTNAQDAMLADAMATLTAEVVETAPVNTRRTRIVEEVAPTPVAGYAVAIAGRVIEVEAQGFGNAVLDAAAIAADSGVVNAFGYVFLWEFSVTDSEGMTLRGESKAMRAALQAARIERADAKRG